MREEIKLRVKTADGDELCLFRNDSGDWFLEVEYDMGSAYIVIPATELWNELAANIAEE